ncbi:MAG: Fic/DOC family N-terminal domain-containing protein [Ignavibacteriaceae bacterium]
MFNRDKPYNDLPLLPPKTELENTEILRTAISANKVLAELKGMARTIPNQAILINTLPLQEAKLSSAIENVLTTNEKLFEAFASKSNEYDPQTKEVLRYKEALWEGNNRLKKNNLLTTNLFISIFQKIKETTAGIRNTPGTKISTSKGEVIYTPPEGEDLIRVKLSNLEEYININDDKTDPLIKLAVIHYQFEAIHPFIDGNGRAGRIINILYLVQQKLLELPVIYLSRYIIENKEDYYRLLKAVTEKNEWTEWILYVLNGILNTAETSINKIVEIKSLLDKTLVDMKLKLPGRIYSKELIELLFTQPYCKVEFVVDAGIAKRQTAAEYLKEIETTGLLKSKKVGKEVLYLNQPLFDLLRN